MSKRGSSPVLRFLGRVLMLIVAFFVWLMVLIGAALVVLLHLMAAALMWGSNRTLAEVLPAEAEAKNDLTSAFRRLLGRRVEPRDATALAPTGTVNRARRA